jgi:acetyl esterase/lipase
MFCENFIKIKSNIRYGYKKDLLLDVYSPGLGKRKIQNFTKGKHNFLLPVVVCVHGGSWMLGNKSKVEGMAKALASDNFIVVCPSYTLAKFSRLHVQKLIALQGLLFSASLTVSASHSILFLLMFVFLLCSLFFLLTISFETFIPLSQHSCQMKDLALAFQWTLKNCYTLGGNKDKIFALGHSAGGHLVTMMANYPKYFRELKLPCDLIKGVVSLSGVYCDRILQSSLIGEEILHTVFGKKKNYETAFPIYHCTEKSPPHLLVNAAFDYMLLTHTKVFAEKLRERQVRVELFLAPGENHFSVRKNWKSSNFRTYLKVISFLTKLSKTKNY